MEEPWIKSADHLFDFLLRQLLKFQKKLYFKPKHIENDE